MAIYLTSSDAIQTNGVLGTIHNGTSGNDESSNEPVAAIAICGMGLRLPGGISTPSQFWDFLINKQDARDVIPNSRFDADAFYSKSGKQGYIHTKYGYFLDESVDLTALDVSLFSMGRSELEVMDPQQRLLLEVAFECLESAGETHYRGSKIGTYIGSFGDDWLRHESKDSFSGNPYKMTGNRDFALSNRIAYEYDLTGPSMTIKTACSAALVALHEACLAIRAGECTAALVGGSNLLLSPDMFINMYAADVLSPEGSCKTFDIAADGYARGEAINMVYIKKLEDAIRDGNPVRAIIRGTSSNAGGKSSSFTMPKSESHEAMIRRAYEDAGIDDFSATPYVECHGTGTPAGDPIETTAVARVFGKKRVYIGSVKPNVGHGEGASGITSLIKCVLALEHRKIPPNIKFNNPNPNIPFAEGKLEVPVEVMDWPIDRSERVSVNSFGIGGSNCHVILESYRIPQDVGRTTGVKLPSDNTQTYLLPYSANTLDSLQRQTSAYEEYLNSHSPRYQDLSYTLGCRRQHFPHRAFSVVGPETALKNSACVKIPASPPKLGMVFTGQGAQWPQMGMELLSSNPVFKRSIRGMDKVLQSLPNPPVWRIEEEMIKEPECSNLSKASISQPLCAALQIALVDALADIGVVPHAVVGHSSGEIAAAYAAKRITAGEAITVAYYRGVISDQVMTPGSMAAVGLGLEEIRQYLIPGVVVACENSPSSVTISGDQDAVADVVESVRRANPNVFGRLLQVNVAYHSHHMKQVGDKYQTLTSAFVNGCHTVPDSAPMMFSSVTGIKMSSKQATDSEYWQRNLESPVLFNAAITALVAHHKAEWPSKDLLFLEVGPHSSLSGPLRQILEPVSYKSDYISCLSRGTNSAQAFVFAIGVLWQRNVDIDFDSLTTSTESKVLTDLPTYSWNHDQSYTVHSRHIQAWKFPEFPKHELLGSLAVESTDAEPSWHNMLNLEQVPWIRDHEIKGDVVFPCAGYVGMVGEASRQTHLSRRSDGEYQGFAIRNMTIDTAMVLTEKRSTEIVTKLHQYKWTDSLDSHWWDFSVTSFNGSAWIKHCTGQVCARMSRPSALFELSKLKEEKLPRKVNPERFYRSWRNVGANYGPYFRGLKDMTCSATKRIARGTAVLSINDEEAGYSVHPTQIDSVIQLLCVADMKGVGHEFAKMILPTSIKSLEVRKSSGDINLMALSHSSSQGGFYGNIDGYNAVGDLVIQMEQATTCTFDSHETEDGADLHAGARVYWQADLDSSKLSMLLKSVDSGNELGLLQELTLHCIMESLSQLEHIEPTECHLKQFLAWMKKQPQPHSTKTIPELSEEIRSGRNFTPIVTGMMKVLQNIVQIFKGQAAPLEILMEDEILHKIYNTSLTDRTNFFRSLGHLKPDIRVLEIGAGTGGTTAIALQGLLAPSGQALYKSYAYTDISGGFFEAGRERFKEYPNMIFKTLDITKDPLEQGFQAESFDLILAANVLHATPSLTVTLTNVRKLLDVDGRLYMEEVCSDCKALNFIMGLLPGWWLGENDGSPDEPFVNPDRWDMHLREAGFSGIEDFAVDGSSLYRNMAYITARPNQHQKPTKTATILYDRYSKDLADRLAPNLLKEGIVASLHDLAQPCEVIDGEVVSVVDLHSPYFDNITPEAFSSFQHLINRLSKSNTGMVWLTRACQLNCSDPRWAQAIGLFRCIRQELGVDFATCELEDTEDATLEYAVKVFAKFQKRAVTGNMKPDLEYAVSGKRVHISRVYPVAINDERPKVRENRCCQLDVESLGKLGSMRWIGVPETAPLSGEVEVEIKAVGANFRDVLNAMGVIGTSKIYLGFEAAGVVSKVGPDVKELKRGDRVFVMENNAYSTHMTISFLHCTKMPDRLSFEEAATLPAAFVTVIYCLIHVGRLEAGESVLIHSACGGVGLAAIQICRMIGAKIYCTVGNEQKVQYLTDNYGIPREHIFNSRDASFLTDVLRITEGQGVDLVLNSLSGELLHASWECVTTFGRMIEIGKRDLVGHGKLDLNPFLKNASYHGIDLTTIMERRPRLLNNLLNEMVKYYEEGFIEAFSERHLFPADKIQDCFRFFQKGHHIGKIVVSMENTELLQLAPEKTEAKFVAEASYLLVGGLGGLGRAVATWMAEHGAGNLVFLSRGAGTNPDDEAFFEELRSQNCQITLVRGSVTVLADVERAIASAPSPVRGVVNMSMQLRDQNFLTMPIEDWNAVAGPKVLGTWNLHNACQTLGIDLDFFLLFGSTSGLMGLVGQASYGGANTFLDAFVQYRKSLGLKAAVIDSGIVKDHGYVAENDMVREQLVRTGFRAVGMKQFLDAVSAAVGLQSHSNYATTFYEPSQLAIGVRSELPYSDPSNHVPWKADRRVALYHNLYDKTGDYSSSSNAKTSGTSSALASFVSAAMAKPSSLDSVDASAFVARQVGIKIQDLLLRPVEDEADIEIHCTLQESGLDSLLAIEMRAWWRDMFKFDISVLEMLGTGNLLALGDRAVEGLKERFGGKDASTCN